MWRLQQDERRDAPEGSKPRSLEVPEPGALPELNEAPAAAAAATLRSTS
jgi:hypothetical protein